VLSERAWVPGRLFSPGEAAHPVNNVRRVTPAKRKIMCRFMCGSSVYYQNKDVLKMHFLFEYILEWECEIFVKEVRSFGDFSL
jgi:hypothetical protein